MAHSVHRGNYGQFSVIARLRQGTNCSLSTLGLILEIQNHLKPYKCMCNVAVSSPNFIIHLPTLELQLQLLSCKEFTGTDYVLDIVPWCSEYTSLELPWIVTFFDQGRPHDIPQSMAEGSSSISQVNLLCNNISVIVDAIDLNQNFETPLDFSYLMVLEMKEFYTAKFKAFQTCEETYKEMYAIADAFSNEMNRVMKCVQEQSSKYNGVPPQDILSRVATFGGDLNNSLWFISEELFDLAISMHLHRAATKQPIDLTAFSHDRHNTELGVPAAALSVLKRIAENASLHIYGKTPLITTAEQYDETFYTQIWCSSFHHGYKAPKTMTEKQAEAIAVYRFLKHITNVLGYTISDHSSDTLSRMVSEINWLNSSVSELHLRINQVAGMVHTVHKNIKSLHADVPSDIWEKQVPHISHTVSDLLMLLQHYSDAVDNGSQTFLQNKQLFRSIKLESLYPSTSDGM